MATKNEVSFHPQLKERSETIERERGAVGYDWSSCRRGTHFGSDHKSGSIVVKNWVVWNTSALKFNTWFQNSGNPVYDNRRKEDVLYY